MNPKSPQYFNRNTAGSGAWGDWFDLDNWWNEEACITRPLNGLGQRLLPDSTTDCNIIDGYIVNNIPTIYANSINCYNYSLLDTNNTFVVSNGIILHDYSAIPSDG